jgi:TolB-like protein/DNA-binding winged helix-turn-helix (wHTH) protein/tetratricopeptide (TPR) repeat protein
MSHLAIRMDPPPVPRRNLGCGRDERHKGGLKRGLIEIRGRISGLEGAIDACYTAGQPFFQTSMSTQGPVVRFGTFELDPRSCELYRNGRRIPLQGQPAQVLCQLVSRPGELVSRDDLRRAVWADDTFVDFDTALNVAINKVRQALQDSASAPRFIETVPRHGYRFLAEVHGVTPADLATPPPPSRRVPRPLTLAAAGLALATAVTLGLLWRRNATGGAPPPIRSVAILPFRSLAGGTADEALQAGMAEAVIIRLGQLRHLKIPSLSTVQRQASRDSDPLAAGRALGMEAVLDGTLLRLDGNLRVSARLLDVEKGTTLWAQQWDQPWTDVFAVQDAMAAQVAQALAVSLAPGQQASLRRRPTSVAAYEPYLRARHFLARYDAKRAAELLEEVVKIDPHSAAAHASLAFAYILIPLGESRDGPVEPFVSLGRQAARRALELDPTLAEAHAVLGRIAFSFDWDPEDAERNMRSALDFDPDDPFTLHCFSMILAQEGRFDESLRLNQRLLDQDPVAALANRDRSFILYIARRYPEAVEQSRKTVELDPQVPAAYYPLWGSYQRLGREPEAVDAYLTALSLLKDEQANVPALREAARRGGIAGLWRRRIEHLLARPQPPAYSLARAYISIGDHDRALAWLEKLYDQRSAFLRTLKVYEEWDPLRGDPRFRDLQRRAKAL